MSTPLQHLLVLLARMFLSVVFIWSGAHHIIAWGDTARMLAGRLQGSLGIRYDAAAHVLLALAVLCLLIGGLSVLLGVKARYGATLLLIFLVPTTFLFHNFWSQSGAAAAQQAADFFKNLGLAGGLLMIVAVGSGNLSGDLLLGKVGK